MASTSTERVSVADRINNQSTTKKSRPSERIQKQAARLTDVPGTKVAYNEVTHEDPLVMSADGRGVVAVIPAYNEEDGIYNCLESLYMNSQQPDLAFVVANNCTDDTVGEVVRFQQDFPEFPLALHHVEGLEGKKVGALCYSWERLEGAGVPFEYFVSMDGDVILDENCIEDLYDEIDGDDEIGGVAARYSFLPDIAKGPFDRLMLFYQRIDFTMWTSNLLLEKNRETYVLGGQVSIMRAEPLREIAGQGDRLYPWSSATAVEDMELTWQLNDAGYTTRCSADARAWVGHMPSKTALWGQRTKWDRGIIDLLRDPAVKGKKSIYLKEPRRQQRRSALDLILRVLFYTALPLALLRGSYMLFEQWWLPILASLPIILSMAIGVISAWITPRRRIGEVIASAVYVPLEGYVWLRTAIWARAWLGSLRGEREDLWANQARSEGGQGAVASGSAKPRNETITVEQTPVPEVAIKEEESIKGEVVPEVPAPTTKVEAPSDMVYNGSYYVIAPTKTSEVAEELHHKDRKVSALLAKLSSEDREATKDMTKAEREAYLEKKERERLRLKRREAESAGVVKATPADAAVPARRERKSVADHAGEPTDRARGNKHRFRVTLLPIFAVLTLATLALSLWVSPAWWLAFVITSLTTATIFLSLIWAWIGDAAKKAGRKAPGARWVTLVVVLIIAALLIFAMPVVTWVIAWLKYFVYMAGTAVDIYLYIAWYSLMAITIYLCVVLIIKMVKVLSLSSKGLRP